MIFKAFQNAMYEITIGGAVHFQKEQSLTAVYLVLHLYPVELMMHARNYRAMLGKGAIFAISISTSPCHLLNTDREINSYILPGMKV
jgi:hypothetical protein